MSPTLLDQQEHAYRSGHQLIAASRRLQRSDQDLVDRISDMAGQLRPNETFKPYLTAYPLPSGADYVLARTWQDIDAPRSGCVRTRSLLVPMETWLSINGIGDLLPLLIPVPLDEKVTPVAPSISSMPAKLVSDPRKVELVEALFLEPRQPIVVFESSEAEAIVERVFAALWPGIKKNFAACSFTLAPRKIDGRDFDLSFAPKSARSRFSDWTGRRIDTVSKDVRHRWSMQIARQIFDSDAPDLRLIDELGSLRADSKGDEGALRLSLLWNELAAKARSTPSAVLGMLDILNSRDSVDKKDGRLSELIGSAAQRAAAGPDEADAWRFLSALATKVTNFDADMLDSLDLRGLSRNLALRAPDRALEFLQSEFAAGREPMLPIVVGLGDGVGESRFDNRTSELALHLPSEASAAMISRSKEFAREVWDRCRKDPSDWIPATVASIRSMGLHDRADLLHRLAQWMTDQIQAPLMEAALDGVTPTDLSDFAVEIGDHTGFAISAFDEPMTNAARDVDSLHRLRASVLSRFASSDADRFLLSTLDLTAADVEWLDRDVPDRARAIKLLRTLIDGASSRTLISVQRDLASRDRILDLLMEDVAGSARQLISIIGSGDFPIARLLDVGTAVLPFVDSEQRSKLISDLLERAFVEADLDEVRVRSLLEDDGVSLASRQLVHFATSPSARTQRVAKNLALLADAPEKIRRSVASVVDELSERLIRRVGENLGDAGYRAWAQLIREAGTYSSNVQLRASLPTLAFALSRKDFPVSTLIGAAFPVVYAELLRSTGEEDFRRLPALLALPLSFFYDWDRAKPARHELVDAYLFSSWPPADLLLTSISAGIQGETLSRLAKTHRGSDYIAAIGRDSHRLEPHQFSQIQDCLSRVRQKL
jgi:hypothetical protein